MSFDRTATSEQTEMNGNPSWLIVGSGVLAAWLNRIQLGGILLHPGRPDISGYICNIALHIVWWLLSWMALAMIREWIRSCGTPSEVAIRIGMGISMVLGGICSFASLPIATSFAKDHKFPPFMEFVTVLIAFPVGGLLPVVPFLIFCVIWDRRNRRQ